MKTRSIVVAVLLVVLIGLTGCEWFVLPGATISLVPTAGAVHTTVILTGQGFGTTQGDGMVTFDTEEAAVETWSDTAIVVRVPVLATPDGSRLVTVTVSRGGAAIGTTSFTVLRGVLFETNRDGNAEIYVMNPDGSSQTNLSNNTGWDSFPCWSPDGTQIAFVTTRNGNGEIYIMDADGSSQTNLTSHPEDDWFPCWSPDGSKIAFMTDREGGGLPILTVEPQIILTPFNIEIFVMNADGSGQQNLTNHSGWDGWPSWSPDGTKIAFQTDRDSVEDGIVIELVLPDSDLGDEVYVMNADGSGQTNLTNSIGEDRYPSWSPNGAKILFQSTRDENVEIYTMNPDGSGQSRLTNNSALDDYPSWSPDGGKITFHSNRDGNTEIYAMNVDGSLQTRLTNDPDWDWGPSWAPDGTKIVFETWRDGNGDIYVMNADGSGRIQLTSNSAWDSHAVWTESRWSPPV